MSKYYCDYCDTYLTHNCPSVRKTHCQGHKHKDNVKYFYQKWMEEQTQDLIDATTAAFKARNNTGMMPPPGMHPGAPMGPGGPVMIGPHGPMGPMMGVLPPMMGPMGPVFGPMGPMGPMFGPMGPMRPPGPPPQVMTDPLGMKKEESMWVD